MGIKDFFDVLIITGILIAIFSLFLKFFLSRVFNKGSVDEKYKKEQFNNNDDNNEEVVESVIQKTELELKDEHYNILLQRQKKYYQSRLKKVESNFKNNQNLYNIKYNFFNIRISNLRRIIKKQNILIKDLETQLNYYKNIKR